MTRPLRLELNAATLAAVQRFGRDPVAHVAEAIFSTELSPGGSAAATTSDPDIASSLAPQRAEDADREGSVAPTSGGRDASGIAGIETLSRPSTSDDVLPPITIASSAGDAESSFAASPPAPVYRGGDTYIAHYYARLPHDAVDNRHTRLGGPDGHG